MEWLQQLQKSVNYIEQHLLDKINYEDVAKSVFMSSYNFHRTFSLMSGMTANEYIRNRRLSMAAQELQTTEISVIDAALKYGYETPESFTKAFSRFHGATPKQAKLKDTPLRLFNPLVIKIILEGGTIMDYKISTRQAQRFLAITKAFSNEIMNDESDHSVSDFWSECGNSNLIEPLRELCPNGSKDLYGLCSPSGGDNGFFDYGIGVLINEQTDKAKIEALMKMGCTIWETTPTEYVVFKCLGEDGDCITQAWNKFYKEFLPQSPYKQTELTDFEIYLENGEKDLFCELWIPVKKK